MEHIYVKGRNDFTLERHHMNPIYLANTQVIVGQSPLKTNNIIENYSLYRGYSISFFLQQNNGSAGVRLLLAFHS